MEIYTQIDFAKIIWEKQYVVLILEKNQKKIKNALTKKNVWGIRHITNRKTNNVERKGGCGARKRSF